MKKIPTLFKREYENHRIVNILPEVADGMEWVLNGEGIATVKWDGACCAIINGEFYKRYDAKNGKEVPYGAIPCQKEPDPATGHWPHWLKVDWNNPADKWFVRAYETCRSDCAIDATTLEDILTDEYVKPHLVYPTFPDGTYEAFGKHFQGNPYRMLKDTLAKHGEHELNVPDRSFDGIKSFLEKTPIEGIVFWKDGEPKCKIKRSDFGFEWGEQNVRK